jgi:hypothetical protein
MMHRELKTKKQTMKRILEVIFFITIMSFNLNAQKSTIQTKSIALPAQLPPMPAVP